MRVNIEQHHIDNGKPLVSCRCPIALATLEAVVRSYPYAACHVKYTVALPDGRDQIKISVELRDFTAARLEIRDWLEMRRARAFMSNFDAGLPVLPFSFDVDFV